MGELKFKIMEQFKTFLATRGFHRGKALPAVNPAGEENDFLHCTLFGDAVPEHVCDLRRAELNEKGDFSCEGCLVDMVLTMHLEREMAGSTN